MFFCKFGRVVAWYTLIVGIFASLMGYLAAQGVDVGEYVSVRNPRDGIKVGQNYIAFAVMLGSLSEIGLTLSKKQNRDSSPTLPDERPGG